MFKIFNDYKLNRKKIEFKKLPHDSKNQNLSKYSVAIIIPHRNRINHLKKFIKHIDDMKQIQKDNKLDIFIIDQNNADKFNRGFLLNIGFLLASKHFNYDRYIFHDVDSYPDEDLFELYFKFIDYNIHFASPELGYKYTHDNFLGGVFGSTKRDYEKINGFPNNFFGWGSEDDAFYNRYAKYNIVIYRPNKGSYILEEHDLPTKSEKNDKRVENILGDLKNSSNNGLNQLNNLFINVKEYEINDFISNYDIVEQTVSKLQSYKPNLENKKYYAFKIDYLAIHTIKDDKLLNKDYIKYSLEVLTSLDEIENKIFKTFTKLNKFTLEDITRKRDLKIKKLVSHNFKETKNNLFKTIKFLFENFNEILYFRIRNNKLECSYHLYNPNNKTDWLKNIKIDNLVDIMNSRQKPYYTLKKPHFSSVDNCLLDFESYNNFKGVKEFKEMIEMTITKFKIVPDCDLIINKKSFPLITKDDFYFIGSQSVNNSLDIVIPSALEWSTLKKYKKIKWDNKKQIAFFRGDSSGCGLTSKNNLRLKLVDISNQSELIDAKITQIDDTLKINQHVIGYQDKYKYMGQFDDGLNYKYIFNIPSNTQSYSFSNELKKNSVILNVKSEYHLWFEPLLKKKHLVNIKSDYSDLLKKIEYLKKNDKIAKDIANNGYKFSHKYINKKMILTYWFYYMFNINKYTK